MTYFVAAPPSGRVLCLKTLTSMKSSKSICCASAIPIAGVETATLSYRLQNQDFEDSAFIDAQSRDEEESGFTLFLARRLTPRIEARFSGSIIERDFEDRGVIEDYITADFRIDWQVGRSLRLFAGANYEERDARGDSPLVDQLTFDEFVYLFGFNFDLINRSKLPQKR